MDKILTWFALLQRPRTAPGTSEKIPRKKPVRVPAACAIKRFSRYGYQVEIKTIALLPRYAMQAKSCSQA